MRKLLVFSLICFSLISFAQVGIQFPDLEGESLTNQMFNLPADASGKYTLLGLAYSKKSESALKTWFSPTYNQFIYKPETPSLFAGNYDVNVFFIPMFTGAKRPAYTKVMDNVKKQVDKALHPYVLFYKGKLKDYKEALQFDGKDIPYFFVLDPDGKIIHTTRGGYSDSKMQQIVDAVEAAWQE
ncbi:MAG: hypothetical protein JXQ90_09350 [Cyclobacteriaceae bacterium]